MSVEPREGRDYLIDLYQVVEVDPGATSQELKSALARRAMEYYPDRLQGLAPKFQEEGDRMAVLLNRARHILLDDERRAEYDEILQGWSGPISHDGTPVLTTERYLQLQVAHMTPDEVAAVFEDRDRQVESLTGYSPSRLVFLESMIEKFGDAIDDSVRGEYEDALLQRDRVLAIQEVERAKLLGMPDISQTGYVAALEYGASVDEAIGVAKEQQYEQARTLALGGVSTRLALLSGEDNEGGLPSTVQTGAVTIELPGYYDEQAAKVSELAHQREEIVKKRLANFRPSYLEAELQVEFRRNVLIHVGNQLWLHVITDLESLQADVIDMPDEVNNFLENDDIKSVIARGYNVLSFPLMEHIDIQDLLSEAIQHYVGKYRK